MAKFLFSTDTDSGTVTVLEIRPDGENVISKIPVGNGPRGAVKFTKDGRGFVSNHAGNTISEIDAYSLREVARITVGIAPIGVAIIPGDRFAIVSNGGDNTVSIVDLRQRKELFAVPVGREPRHPDITPDGKFAYIPISGSDYVAKLNTSPLLGEWSGEKISEIARIFLGEGTMPYSAAVSPSGKNVIAANNQKPFVSIISVERNNVEKEVEVGNKGARGTAYNADGSIAFVTIEDTSEIVAIDVESGTIIQRYQVGPGPRGIIFDKETETIYASAFNRCLVSPGRLGNAVSALTLRNATLANLAQSTPVIRDMPVGAGPCSISIFSR